MIRFLQTPGPALKIILGGILLVICASMVITLVPGGIGNEFLSGQPGKGIIAKVGSEEVTATEVQRTAQAMIRRQFPKGGPDAAMLMSYLASQAAEQLITQKAVLAEAQRMGLRVSDAELRDEMQHGQLGAILFPGGKFIGQEGYDSFAQSNNLTIPQLEQLETEMILERKLRNLVTGAATVSDADVRKGFDKANTKVKFEYAVLSQEDIRKSLHPTEAELKSFYEQKRPTYTNSIPERRKIKFVSVDIAKLAAEVQVTPQELQSYYTQHRDEYQMPEQVKVSHILIKTPLPGAYGKVDEKGVEEARTKAEDVLKQIKAGGDFAKLAEKYSDDPGSAKQGGALGWIGRGRNVPEFEKAAFSLGNGQISDLVKSSYGFHIIKGGEKQQAHLRTMEEVRPQVEPVLKQQKAAGMAEAAANGVLNQAKALGLEKAAEVKKLPVVTTDFFARNENPRPGELSPQFLDAVFAVKEKSPPEVAATAQGYAVFELEGIKPPGTPTFEEIRARVEEDFKGERTGALLQQKTQELADRAKAGHDLKKAAKEAGAQMKTSEFVAPDGQVPDLGSMSGQAAVAFSLKPGGISGPLISGQTGAVLQVLERKDPTEEEYAQKKDQFRDQELQGRQNELFGLFVSNLRAQMEKSGKIKVNQQELKILTHRGQEEGQ